MITSPVRSALSGLYVVISVEYLKQPQTRYRAAKRYALPADIAFGRRR